MSFESSQLPEGFNKAEYTAIKDLRILIKEKASMQSKINAIRSKAKQDRIGVSDTVNRVEINKNEVLKNYATARENEALQKSQKKEAAISSAKYAIPIGSILLIIGLWLI